MDYNEIRDQVARSGYRTAVADAFRRAFGLPPLPPKKPRRRRRREPRRDELLECFKNEKRVNL